MDIYSILSQQTWRFIENSQFAPQHDALASFALDDALCEAVGQKRSLPIARSWIHDKTIVLGIQDGRLPELKEGVEFLKKDGWNVIVRNSGGLAVVLDQGIYNLSLILHEKDNGLSIEKAFETMAALLKMLLAPYGIDFQTGEIIGSYCPGKYDLSVNGKKFAGISQRRIRGGAAVQVYLCTSGSGSDRARVIEQFYERAARSAPDRRPPIYPETMASLAEISRQSISHAELNERLIQLLQKNGPVIQTDLDSEEAERFQFYYERVAERSNKVLLPLNV